jgi:demethylmenaquinone methyltransferase/2-methoxy-6-polyprenyl-1,4-benzoquinol methylase
MSTAPQVVPYKNDKGSKKQQVAKMFDNISPKYDLLNRLLSFGIDKYWRNMMVGKLKNLKPSNILDIATGTGDLAIACLKLNPEKIVGVDISEGMMELGREKLKKLGLTDKIELKFGDSEKLPFSDKTFHAVTVAFGVRNFENLDKGLSEIFRVTKKGGMTVILEFSKPKGIIMAPLYQFYSSNVLPFIGRLISSDQSAYTYLPESVKAFPEGEPFLVRLRGAGFEDCRLQRLTFGIVSIYTGSKKS